MLTAMAGSETWMVMVMIAFGAAVLFLICVAMFGVSIRRLYHR